jgi:hypothetical protein
MMHKLYSYKEYRREGPGFFWMCLFLGVAHMAEDC